MPQTLPTPHIAASSTGDFASTVLMPGDPLRAKFIAETYFAKARIVNHIRGTFAYTGEYKGVKVSVMASGMGMPSMGIYSYELFKFYQVERILRIGSCGALRPELELGQVLLVDESWSESTFALLQSGYKGSVLQASAGFNSSIAQVAAAQGCQLSRVRAHCTDVFYAENPRDFERVRDLHGCDVVEMESFALFANGMSQDREVATLLTISDSLCTGEQLSAEARRSGFKIMIELALEAAVASEHSKKPRA